MYLYLHDASGVLCTTASADFADSIQGAIKKSTGNYDREEKNHSRGANGGEPHTDNSRAAFDPLDMGASSMPRMLSTLSFMSAWSPVQCIIIGQQRRSEFTRVSSIRPKAPATETNVYQRQGKHPARTVAPPPEPPSPPEKRQTSKKYVEVLSMCRRHASPARHFSSRPWQASSKRSSTVSKPWVWMRRDSTLRVTLV